MLSSAFKCAAKWYITGSHKLICSARRTAHGLLLRLKSALAVLPLKRLGPQPPIPPTEGGMNFIETVEAKRIYLSRATGTHPRGNEVPHAS